MLEFTIRCFTPLKMGNLKSGVKLALGESDFRRK